MIQNTKNFYEQMINIFNTSSVCEDLFINVIRLCQGHNNSFAVYTTLFVPYNSLNTQKVEIFLRDDLDDNTDV